ncbi:MAG: PaaI family thioesterase [Desulfuromonas sp.]|nr:PaaI family thioesterase [Desulfuromonas sp.]
MQVADDAKCFACGQENPYGLKACFELDYGKKSSCCQIQLTEQFQGWQGVVHGGILATLLDEASVYACRTLGETFVTAELTVRYKKPVAVAQTLEISAKVVEQKRRIFIVKAQIEMDGQVCVEADAKIFAVQSKAPDQSCPSIAR